jgi:hypothetical protein
MKNFLLPCKQNQLGVKFFLICLLLFSTCFGKPCAHHQEKIPYLFDTWYLSLYIDNCLVGRAEWVSYGSHMYGIFSWWWAHICPKHVEKSNINNKKICAPSWFYLQKIITWVMKSALASVRPCLWVNRSWILNSHQYQRNEFLYDISRSDYRTWSVNKNRGKLCVSVQIVRKKVIILFVICLIVHNRYKWYKVLIYFQRDAILHSLFISGKMLYVFRVISSPIIRSTYNCIYSIRYLLTITAICLCCGRVVASLSVAWELYRSATWVADRYNSHTTFPEISKLCKFASRKYIKRKECMFWLLWQ